MSFFEQLSANISIFSAAMGMNAAILDDKGVELANFGEKYKFCQMYHAHSGEMYSCGSIHRKGGQFAATLGDCYFYLCSAQLVHFSVAITESNRYVGSVLVGPVLLPRMGETPLDGILQGLDTSEDERCEFRTAYDCIPLIDAARAHHVGKLLFQLVCNLLSHDDLQITLERGRVSRQQAQIGEFLQRIGDTANPSEVQLKQEQELTERILNGDIDGAQQLLNNIIARIYFSVGSNVELVKIRMNELVSVLSRVVLQTCATPNEVYRIVRHFQQRCLGCSDLVELSHALAETLRVFIDLVRDGMADRQNNVIKRSQQYIDDNFSNRISVEDVARHVTLSPSYFSHLFKERTGLTFSAYLNNCRIDQAKQMLRGSDIPLADLAQHVGYDNQQYFSRVFKKATGYTPGHYRRQAGE